MSEGKGEGFVPVASLSASRGQSLPDGCLLFTDEAGDRWILCPVVGDRIEPSPETGTGHGEPGNAVDEVWGDTPEVSLPSISPWLVVLVFVFAVGYGLIRWGRRSRGNQVRGERRW